MNISWRELYQKGAFAQRELGGDSRFRSAARDRELRVGLGQGPLEELDAQGALRPIAFATEGYWTGFTVPAETPGTMLFSDELEPTPWAKHAWRNELEPDFAQISPLYSPWQLLYLDEVLAGTSIAVSSRTLVADPDDALATLGTARAFAEARLTDWRTLDDAWRPLMKLLVALQNRYWPTLTGVTRMIANRTDAGYSVAGAEIGIPAPPELAARLELDEAHLTDTYHFLVERGLSREPQDGLMALRRARPRAFHLRWRDTVLRAQDCFDAAELIRLFLVDLTGQQPPRPGWWPMDGRQPERALLYQHGPGASWSPEQIKEQLLLADLYPHGVHVIGEGPSEQIVVEYLVEVLIGYAALAEVAFYDLQGSGSAAQVEPLSQALAGYAIRCLVIVDSEGQMADYLKTSIEYGKLDLKDVLLFDDSLEAANASHAELIELAARMAAALAEPIAFELTPDELREYHADRLERSSRGSPPGLADSLITLVRRKTDGRLNIDKLKFVEALAEMMATEISEEDADLDEIGERRPIVAFVVHRLIGALNRPRPAGHGF